MLLSKQASFQLETRSNVSYSFENLVPVGQEEGQPLGTLVEQDIPVTFLFTKVKLREGEPCASPCKPASSLRRDPMSVKHQVERKAQRTL